MSDRFSDNADKRRLELVIDSHLAFAEYVRRDGVLTLPRVEANLALRGTGSAGRPW